MSDTKERNVADAAFVWSVLDAEGVFESPADINLSHATAVNLPQLTWANFETTPKKMKVTNTGHTVILSAKWGQERPYVTDGPLAGKYVFSQLHFHWGADDTEGSEHTIDGARYPSEMHLVTFKSCYLTQESALKEKDGIAIFVYMLKLQERANPDLRVIFEALTGVVEAHSSRKLEPTPLSSIVRRFVEDYFVYCGSVSTEDCVHYVMWLITRVPVGVSSDQVDSLRYLTDYKGELIKRNFRAAQSKRDRKVFHVCPSASKYSTLLPVP